MNAQKLLTILGAIALIFSPAHVLSQPTTQPESHLSSLISNLSSDEAAKRQEAADQLVALGQPARPAVLKAAQSDDPDLKSQAAQILFRLPWSIPTDSEKVTAVLADYDTPEIATRRNIVDALAGLPDAAGVDALCRLLLEEPSQDVLWTIVRALRQYEQSPQLIHFRKSYTPPDNATAPMFELCGYLWLNANLSRGITLLNRCAEIEFSHPSDDAGAFDDVVATLADYACQQKKIDDAASLRRRQYSRGALPDDPDSPDPLAELFALHAEFGPLKGFDDDQKLSPQSMTFPRITYALARMYARTNQPEKAKDLRQRAFDASTTREQRYQIGEFLVDHAWDDLAKPEIDAALKMPPDDQTIEANDTNLHFRLASIAIRAGDDFAAAHEKESAMETFNPQGGLTRQDGRGHQTTISPDDIWAEVYWRYYRAAVAKNDDATAMTRLNQLLALKPTDSEIAIDIVPALKTRGLTDDAQSLFRASCNFLEAQLQADPDNPSMMNQIAWLGAECTERLPEALKYAASAVAAEPDNPAYIDTLADVNYRLKHFAKAVELESRTISLRPDDKFMTTQLRKFKQGDSPSTQPDTAPATHP